MVYIILRVFVTCYLRLFHSLKIIGAENIPADGPVILCANHSSFFDSMLVGLCTKRHVRFIVYYTYYSHWLLGPFIKAFKAIPITQKGTDKEAMKKALNVLKNGGVISIFPEGRMTLTGLPGPAKPGMALLSALSNAQIVPITIIGAFYVYPRWRKLPMSKGKIMVKVHPPVKLDPDRRHEKGYLQGVTNQVMGIIERGIVP